MGDFGEPTATDDFVAVVEKLLSAYINITASILVSRKQGVLPQSASERCSLNGSRRRQWRAAAVKRGRRWQSRPATGTTRSATGLDSVGSAVIVAFAVTRAVGDCGTCVFRVGLVQTRQGRSCSGSG